MDAHPFHQAAGDCGGLDVNDEEPSVPLRRPGRFRLISGCWKIRIVIGRWYPNPLDTRPVARLAALWFVQKTLLLQPLTETIDPLVRRQLLLSHTEAVASF